MTLLTPYQDISSQSQDSSDVVLRVSNVSKRFCRDLKRSLLYGVQDIAGEMFGSQRRDVQFLRDRIEFSKVTVFPPRTSKTSQVAETPA